MNSKPRKSYTASYKRHIIDYAQTFSIKDASQRFTLDHSMVYRWVQSRDKIEAQCHKKKTCRRIGSGRTPHYEHLEVNLLHWILSQRSSFLSVSHEDIQKRMLQMVRSIEPNSTFKASQGWLKGFLNRYKLSMRKPTNTITKKAAVAVGQSSINVDAEKMAEFRTYVNEAVVKYQIPDSNILNVDQTPVWLNMASSGLKTIDSKGAKKVTMLRPEGNPREKVSIILACSRNGKKLPPAIVVKSGRQKPRLRLVNGVLVFMNPATSMCNSRIMTQWMQIMMSDTKSKCLLILDSFSGHLTTEVADTCKSLNIVRAVIPGGMTSQLQPLDISVNRSFKSKMRKSFQFEFERRADFIQGRTAMEQNLQWITLATRRAWNAVDASTIKAGFHRALSEINPFI